MCERVTINKKSNMWRSKIRVLSLLTFLIVLRYHFANAVITYSQCDAMSVLTIGCNCKRDISMNMEISCPLNENNSSIKIVINRGSQVHVTCRGPPDTSFTEAALQALPVGPDVMLFVICGCNNFDVILERLGIHDTRLLDLSAAVNVTSAKLTRQQLPKGMVVRNLKLTHYTQLAYDLFADYAQLQYLEIEASALELPQALFQPLRNLIGLTLKGRITLPPVGMFSGQSRLINIVLRDGALPYLNAPLFPQLPQLQSIHLPRNKIRNVPEYALALHIQLLRINLCDNRLRALPATMFLHQRTIVSIDLSENQLETLPPELFAHTYRLEELHLSHNRLQSLSAHIFSQLNYLKKLYLNNNQLQSLHPHTFANNSELLYLHLQNNQIAIAAADACRTFGALNNLAELLLRNNSLARICDLPIAIKKMGRIDLSHNRIEVLEAPTLVALACTWLHVDLSHNGLQTILFPESIRGATGASVARKALPCASNIILSYNSLHCDCNLVSFVLGHYRRFLTANTLFNTTHLSCASPNTLRNRLVDTLQPSELICPVIADYCPTRCRCWARTYDATFIVNCTQARLNAVPALPSLNNLTLVAIELDITNNTIKMLPSNTTNGYALVTHIYAAANHLRVIEASHLPARLTYLDVRYNRFTQLSASFYTLLNATQTLNYLFLSHNPWTCNCSTEQLLIAARVHYNRIRDLDELSCADARYPKILELSFSDICPEDLTRLFALISLLATGFLLAIISALYFRYTLEINVWLYAHNACLWCVTEYELDKDKLFDAFISYSHKDERFVVEELLPALEHGDIPFRICTHERNWLAGAYIPEQIIESVEQSRRTIIVLSQNFVESDWARMEFRTAHQSALNEGRTRIILIMYSELLNMDALDTELQAYLKMNTYLKWSDARFWDKLRYAMPHKRRSMQGADDEPRYIYSAMELKDLIGRARGRRNVEEMNI